MELQNVMKPYSRNSLYRFASLRRALYGRGYGVHSPKAYALIQQLVRPRGTYYAFEDFPTLFRDPTLRLVHRAVARLDPSIVLPHTSYPNIKSAINYASASILGGLEQMGHDFTLIITEDFAEVNLAQNSLYIVLGIRKDRGREEDFWAFSQELSEGLIIDLFDHAIVAFVPNVRYLYRSSL